MNPFTVAIIGMGEMGSALGHVLTENGVRVTSFLKGRSELTKLRATESGVVNMPSYKTLVREASVILSVLPSPQGWRVAKKVAHLIQEDEIQSCFVDCNAISPAHVIRISQEFDNTKATFIDAGIIGVPPGTGTGPRVYCSGPNTSGMMSLSNYGIDVRDIGNEIGHASALKMLYAASNKGNIALFGPNYWWPPRPSDWMQSYKPSSMPVEGAFPKY